MQTAVINIRKYKRILYFLMFIPAVCFFVSSIRGCAAEQGMICVLS